MSKGDKEKLKQEKHRKDWEKKRKKQREKVCYNYFGKPLSDVGQNENLIPKFVEKCLEHIESAGNMNLFITVVC